MFIKTQTYWCSNCGHEIRINWSTINTTAHGSNARCQATAFLEDEHEPNCVYKGRRIKVFLKEDHVAISEQAPPKSALS